MSRTKLWALCATVAAAAGGLAGCPFAPNLFITPLSLSFPATGSTVQTFRISNEGAGVLEFTATENVPWLEIADVSAGKQGSPVTGRVAEGFAVIEVRLLRAALPEGASQTDIAIASNGGEGTVRVSATRGGAEGFSVAPQDFDFGSAQTQATMTITNTGATPVNWSIVADPSAPWVAAAPASGGIDAAGQADEVTLTVSRAALLGGSYTGEIVVSTNLGDFAVPVSMRVAPFSVAPPAIDFGRLRNAASQSLQIGNNTFDPLTVSLAATTNNGGAWLSAAAPSILLADNPDAAGVVDVIADPTGLGPGEYTGQIAASAAGATIVVPVSMRVSPTSVSPALIDFGTLAAPASDTFTIGNGGPTAIPFAITVPAADRDWLSVSPASGEVGASAPIAVTVDPAAVDPGQYESQLDVQIGEDTETVTVRFRRPTPASLTVSPNEIDFGTSLINATIGIWNPGVGSVNWRIDTNGFPAWLSLTPVDGSGIASGTVAGDESGGAPEPGETDTVQLRVNRSLAPDDLVNFQFAFNVEGTGSATVNVPVAVRMTKPRIPEILVIGDGVDTTGVPFVNYDVDEDEGAIFIRNTGNGPLTWRIDTESAPVWITSIVPPQGTVDPGLETKVDITVDRTTLTFVGAQAELEVISDDPLRPESPFTVEVQVAKRLAIGSRQGSGFAFGINANTGLFEVANIGDPETVLTYRITVSKEWLSVFPETGTSVGTSSPIKDWQEHTLAIDRSLLEGNGASATITVQAFKIEDGIQVPDTSVPILEVPVTVEAATLTIEGAVPRGRIPSLVRSVYILRNIRYQALPIPDSRLQEVGDLFVLSENSTPLERTETNQFLRSGNRLRGNVIILLDYSGSMRAAAESMIADGQLPPAAAADPVQAMYNAAIPQLINELPDNYRIALAVFNERTDGDDVIRILRGSALEPAFTSDRAVLLDRLANANVLDNGASQTLAAIVGGANAIVDEDFSQGLISFDDADVRAILAVTDGRITTVTTQSLNDTIDVLEGTNTRFMCVGFGDNVAANPLVRLAIGSGGHLYSTRNQPTGEFDPFGQPIKKPVLAELIDWCVTDPLDACDQSISKDLKSQVVLSYVTLLQQPGVTLNTRLTFNDPNDQNSECLADQGEITGDFEVRQLGYDTIAGDVRLGQISLRTEGIQPDGTAVVVVRGEYIPRNIASFTFDIQAPWAFTVSQVPASRGGIVSDWTASNAGSQYTFTSPGGPLQYGEFGDLLEVRFTGLVAPFELLFNVVAPDFQVGNPDSKYFVHPDSIAVFGAPFFATAFPRAFLVSTPPFLLPGDPGYDPAAPDTIDLGTTASEAEVRIFNLGGSYTLPGGGGSVGYAWEPLPDGAQQQFFLLDPEDGGFVTSTLVPDLLTVGTFRCSPPGVYEVDIRLAYGFGAVDFGGTSSPFRVRYTVLPPVLALSTAAIDFGTADTERTVQVLNAGQSLLAWELADPAARPDWLGLTALAGEACPDIPSEVIVRVDRTGLAPGAYAYDLVFDSDASASQTLTVTMTVP